jgi:hypothetical protein
MQHSSMTRRSRLVAALPPLLLLLLLLFLQLQQHGGTATVAAAASLPDAAAFVDEAHRSFAALIAPLTIREFFERHWERRVLFQSRDDEQWFAGGHGGDGINSAATTASSPSSSLDLQLGMESLRLILDSGVSAFTDPATATMAVEDAAAASSPSPLTSADLKLVQRVLAADGEHWTAVVPLSSALRPGAVPDSRFVFAGLGRGFTLVLNRLNFRHAPVGRLCHMLSREIFGFRVQANLYATPSNSSGFEAHFDWQQSFVMQLAGRKRWTIYSPPLVRLPRADMKFKPRRSSLAQLQPSDLLLTEGSTLYFPSGFVHEATTTAAAPAADIPPHSDDDTSSTAAADAASEPLPLSVHLTLGVEIDPLFTSQGLLHVLLEQLKEDALMASVLMAPLPPCSCVTAAPNAAPMPALRFRDFLHLAVLQLASRRDEEQPKQQSSSQLHAAAAVPAHHFRRALWGLHRWTDGAADAAAAVPFNSAEIDAILSSPNGVGSQASGDDSSNNWQLLNPSARHSIAFQTRAAERLGLLLQELTAQLLPPTEDTAGVRAVIEFAARMQARRLADAQQANDATAADGGGTSAANPSQAAYDFEHVFADATLSPWVEPGLQSDLLTGMLADSSCAAACTARLRTHLAAVWSVLSAQVQLPAWSAWATQKREARCDPHRSSGSGTSSQAAQSTPLPERPAELLQASLRFLREQLSASQQRHPALQDAHLRVNLQRAQAHLRKAAAARANAAAAVHDVSSHDRDL